MHNKVKHLCIERYSVDLRHRKSAVFITVCDLRSWHGDGERIVLEAIFSGFHMARFC